MCVCSFILQSVEFSRPEYWSGLPFLSSGDLPNPGIEPRCATLQADSLPAEPPGKPNNTGVCSLSLLQGIFPTQESNQGLQPCKRILYQLRSQGSPILENVYLFIHFPPCKLWKSTHQCPRAENKFLKEITGPWS